MLTSSQIEELKSIFGPLHKVKIEGTDFIFRTLTRQDAAVLKIFKVDDLSSIEEDILDTAIIDPRPYNYNDMSAGSVSFLIESILNKSGLLNPGGLQELLDNARLKRSIYDSMYEVILMALPSINVFDLDGLTIDKLLYLFITAENILIQSGVIEGEIRLDDGSDQSEGYQQNKSEDVTAQMLQNALEDAQRNGYI